jgi:hypothetical protein
LAGSGGADIAINRFTLLNLQALLSNKDLFWAIRGVGGTFGVVTEFEFALHDMPVDMYGGIIQGPRPAISRGHRLHDCRWHVLGRIPVRHRRAAGGGDSAGDTAGKIVGCTRDNPDGNPATNDCEVNMVDDRFIQVRLLRP